MYLLLIFISLIALIITRIYIIFSEQKRGKRIIGDKLLGNKYKINEININFGSKLYTKFKTENNFDFAPNLYSKSPTNGINYCVKYIDTKVDNELIENSAPKPLIVLLHGNPGSVYDFDQFAEEFGDNYRLIIPQWPDFELSRDTEQFWHSNEEKVHFLLTFLRALNVKEVDCFVCHSGGNPVVFEIISDESEYNLIIKSFVMITSPGIQWLNSFQLKNSRNMVKIASNWWKRNLYLILWPDWLSILMGVPATLVKNTTKDDFFWMTFVVTLSDFEVKMEKWLKSLAQKQIPTLFVMGEKDGLFPKYKYLKSLDVMGGNREECFTHIDSEGRYESKASTNDWIRVLNFRTGGHFCFKKYSDVFHKEFTKFFESIN